MVSDTAEASLGIGQMGSPFCSWINVCFILFCLFLLGGSEIVVFWSFKVGGSEKLVFSLVSVSFCKPIPRVLKGYTQLVAPL